MEIDREDKLAEEELIQLILLGSPDAFAAIYKRYSKRLFLKILRMVNDEETAKELLQDLFMKIWEGRKNIDTSRSFRSYLYTIGVNLVYDHFRKAVKDRQLADKILLMAADAYIDTEENIISKQNMELIRTAVDQLPPQRKKVYTLCRLEGKTYDEVSKELHISSSTIHDHMVKANVVVRNYLHNHPDLAAYSLAVIIFSNWR
ncbi:RNA polymerase sigma-70 factor, ECF subfamily [Mucilaginibacter pineti]|uniref:RNA polymerase sigma-70 factor, ECF subfamily n=1 Tax=Mucilaginibacter pineti TaxID=1391627 RepID=A0A1G6X096_9SPHI|nr:RNA polymerase sigma-70 factor [Mucilaginibacter pineti]SDD71650.1 RNA polymerase sigma-70 factor, ECF subfamily [Mucilaginibacter pineti]